jgi:hypothetical protein
MFNSHIKISASAYDLEQLKNALLSIISKLDNEEIATVLHDDYHFSFETFDNDTLQTFQIDPDEFLFLDLPSNL